jgi:ubiquinone/menaquinone biosynthesis C-methylase UbiE
MSTEELEQIRAQFTRQADAYAAMEQTRDQGRLDALVALSGAGSADRVLDVACGPGFLTLTFAARCAEAVGVDATPAWRERATAEAERRGLTNARFETGDAQELPFPAGGFDVVSCRAAFHHFPRPARVLAEMIRVARPGGRLVVADMLGSDDPAKAALHDRIEQLCDPSHARALPRSEFARFFGDAGLEIEREIPTTMDYDLSEWLAHGGPDAATASEIAELFEASLAGDSADLAARRVDGRLRFRHRVTVFVLRTLAR